MVSTLQHGGNEGLICGGSQDFPPLGYGGGVGCGGRCSHQQRDIDMDLWPATPTYSRAIREMEHIRVTQERSFSYSLRARTIGSKSSPTWLQASFLRCVVGDSGALNSERLHDVSAFSASE